MLKPVETIDPATEALLEQAARVAHEVNRAYCSALGDRSQVAWDDAEEWQWESARAGALVLALNPTLSAEEMHRAWMQHKLEAGWVFGPVKDARKKTHPSLRPYNELLIVEQIKDHLFRAVVHQIVNYAPAKQGEA